MIFGKSMKTQRDKVLQLLQEAKTAGVNSYDLTYVYSIKQAPTRIKELKEEGYVITSQTLANRSVQYILNGVPQEKRTFTWDFRGGTARRVYQ